MHQVDSKKLISEVVKASHTLDEHRHKRYWAAHMIVHELATAFKIHIIPLFD